jgi:spermidine synthase
LYGSGRGTVVFSFPWWLSFLIGFLSLSQEILWVRVVGFTYYSLPAAFSFVLACYLVGIASGAAFGKRLCARTQNLYGAAAVALSIAALFDVLTPGLFSAPCFEIGSNLGPLALLIATTAALKSVLFPIVHHLGSVAQGSRVGRSVSRIYFGNIMGATLGPLVTGFVALDYLNVDQCFALAAALCLLASLACVLKSGRQFLIGVTLGAALLAGTLASRLIQPGPGALGKLAEGDPRTRTHFLSNRHGVVHTVPTANGDVVYGGNVYDGIAAVNVDNNANRLDRLYLMALLHPDPKRILVVGLSAGSWVRVMEGFPGVERIDVIEINPAYLELVRSYPNLAPLLEDTRIHIHIDDGRRWLKRNPDTRFDLIVQNTTFHFRANAANLLSREYFAETRRHLNAGGVVCVNTTGSFDVLRTGQAVFAHAYRNFNFMYASDAPLTPVLARLWKVTRPEGTLFTNDAAPVGSVVSLLAHAKLEPVEELLARRNATAEIITDDNLLSEYRHGRHFGPPILWALQPPHAEGF